VTGTSFTSLDIGLPVGRLKKCIEDVIAGGPDCRLEVEAVNRRGRQAAYEVTITALATARNDVEGAVVLVSEASTRCAGDEGDEQAT
jgi:hypothetical protein